MSHIPIKERIEINANYEEYATMNGFDTEAASNTKGQPDTSVSSKQPKAYFANNAKGVTDSYTAYFSLAQETTKAVLLQPNPELPTLERADCEWVPRSQIQQLQHTGDFDDMSNESIVEVTMSKWIAGKKGWL